MQTVLILLSLVLSALFSGAEISYVSANKLRVELKKKRGTRRSRILARWFDQPAEFLSTMLVGNNIALVAFTTLMSLPLSWLINTQLGIEGEATQLLLSTVLITLIVLVFGEYVPKTVFRLFADDALYFFALPLRGLQWLLYLPSLIMTKTSNWLLKLVFNRPGEELDTVLTRLDLENFVNESQASSDEETNGIDTKLFGNALNLHDVRVRDCMVPRTEIQSIDVAASLDDLAAKFQETRLSRLIVTDGEIDAVLGYVHHQQLLKLPESLASMVMELTFVPEVARVTDVLNRSIKEQLSIACVVDEFGSISGVITMEDLLEQIFGEIEDEYDDDEYVEEVLEDGVFRFSGRLEIDYLNEKYNLNLPEGDYHTLSGFVVTEAERVPEENDELELKGFHLRMLEVSNTRIEVLELRFGPEENE
ncbi:hemolysin family protein [Neolewinella lacunae]|uniref:HlyC/CorC family transporter n=1 Tax=Neolewinella lacunae TaxID=1517758 RepID=A0A923PQI1_9BACT|nr:hemolysin family protein [Neolewinella lacunae]MBC6996695.1 HlyC/CorC family transporter [Neolewinella lacunae]MDN3633440.1 hemolysin family protein [Neolewinella lacunae]